MLKYGENVAKEDNFFDHPLSYNFFKKKILPNGQRVVFGYREGVEHREFLERRTKDTYRIFCLGDSTVRGALVPEASFSKFLNLIFCDILPGKRIEIINAGVGGFDSSRTLELLLETLSYSPNLIIIYSSNNEFFHQNIPPGDSWMVRINRSLNKSRLYFLLKRNVLKVRDRLIDNNFDWDKKRKANSMEIKYQRNMEEMVRRTLNKGIEVLLCMIPVNLKNQPPVESKFSEGLSNKNRHRYKEIFDKGIKLFEEGNYLLALSYFKKCLRIDTNYALDYYYTAKCYEKLGQYEKAKYSYQQACDFDGYKQRTCSSLNQVVKDTSAKFKVPLVDLVFAFERESLNGLVGDNLFYDPVHPLPIGYWIIAKEICDVLYKNGLVAPKEKWRWDRLKTKEEYTDLLISDYNYAFAFIYFYTGVAYSNENWNCPGRAVSCFRKAINQYENIIEKELDCPDKFKHKKWWKSNPCVFLNIGKAFLEESNFHKALVYINNAIEINPKLEECYLIQKTLASKIETANFSE